MSRVALKPFDLGESGWNSILPERVPSPPLNEDIESDFCIVGAGIAGLSAAHRLSQLTPDAKVVLETPVPLQKAPQAETQAI